MSWGAAETRGVSRKQGRQAGRQAGIDSVDSRKLPRDEQSDRQPESFSIDSVFIKFCLMRFYGDAPPPVQQPRRVGGGKGVENSP